jgi:phosphinothricin acetyltransferase
VSQGAHSARPARLEDAPEICAIYNEGIRGRRSTFESEERNASQVHEWFGSAQHPFLVIEEQGRVAGWVRASTYRSRACYSGIAEFSVYVGDAWQRRGIGHALMSAFIPECERVGLWKLVSRIFVDNAASRALCARHGFREVGLYEKHGKLDGIWRDVVIVERLLAANLK